jgi:hypothetical protein
LFLFLQVILRDGSGNHKPELRRGADANHST